MVFKLVGSTKDIGSVKYQISAEYIFLYRFKIFFFILSFNKFHCTSTVEKDIYINI